MVKEKKNKNTTEEMKEEIKEEEIIEEADVEKDSSSDEKVNEKKTSAEEPPIDMEELKSALDEATKKSAEYLDGWQRARAEFLNYKKRVEREREQRYQDAVGSIVLKILPIVDDLERALKDRPQDDSVADWVDGIELIYKKLQAILESEGVRLMEAEGEMFNPDLHEAIAQVPSEDHESGQIIEVVQQGYYIGERVLRPALVRVAS